MHRMPSRVQLSEVILHECGTYHRQNQSASVSWNCTGRTLASSSHSGAKLWSTDSLQTSGHQNSLREISNINHTAPVDRVRFHPSEASLLCTNAEDKTVNLWDVRSARSLARIQLQSNCGKCAASVEWQASGTSNLLAITEKDNSVHLHDVRKLQNKLSNTQKAKTNPSSSEVKMFQFNDVLADTHFSPSGTHLVSAARRIDDGMGIIHVYPWETSAESGAGDKSSFHRTTFVGHTGNIYSLIFSPDGKKMATGGNDALVGLWDVQSLVCKATISRRTKFIRSVAFSFDSKVVACCSEEKGIDLADAETGELIGEVSLAKPLVKPNDRDRGQGAGFGTVGSDEIAFHPKAHIIACARGENLVDQVPQVSIARIRYSQMQ